jgi:hypothetical protein
MSEQSSERADTEHARLILENIVQFSQAARRIDMLNIRKLFMVTVWFAAFQSSPYVNAAVHILDS